MRSLLLTSVDASRTKRTAGNHRFKIISQWDEGVKIKSFLIIVGAIITVACPVAKAAEEDDQQKQEPKTYERCVLAASEKNTKWTQYRVDVNNCRAEFGIPGEY
jgi:hypothetical protein|tara:strand:- start:196 stop:507 length:312 start_codon:yes stop_codon:yes gene_type:complete